MNGYQSFSRNSFLFFAAAAVIYLIAMVLTAAEIVITGGGTLRSLLAPLCTISAVRCCFLLYLAWGTLSALLSSYDGVWLGLGRNEGLFTLVLYISTFWFVSAYGKWDNRFLYLLGAVTVVNAVIGLLQFAGKNSLHLFPAGTNYHDAFVLYSGQFMGTFGNVDILSAFLCLAVPVFYGAYLVTGRRLSLLPMGAGIFLLALADVDSGYLGLAGALFLTIPIYYTRRQAWSRGAAAFGVLAAALGAGKLLQAGRGESLSLRFGCLSTGLVLLGLLLIAVGSLLARRKTVDKLPSPETASRRLWLTLGLLFAAGLAAVYLIPFASGPAYELRQILHGNPDPSFGSGRIRIWKEVLRLIGEAPLLGGGPDTLIARIPFTFTRYSEEVGGVVEAVVDAAHNDLLNIAVNLGLPALGFYLAGLTAWFTGLKKRSNPAALILLPGIVGYLLQGCFTISVCTVAAPFWILLALGEPNIKS